MRSRVEDGMMPLVCGPKNSRYTYTGSRCPHTDLALAVNAATVGEAVAAYELRFHCRVERASDDLPALRGQEGRYFLHTDLTDGVFSGLVRISIDRNGETIDVRQNLDVPLEQGDIVDILQLIGSGAS